MFLAIEIIGPLGHPTGGPRKMPFQRAVLPSGDKMRASRAAREESGKNAKHHQTPERMRRPNLLAFDRCDCPREPGQIVGAMIVIWDSLEPEMT